ncbi:LysR family transcriptional regulator [Buttiauxella sp. A111]|uniref:LysR family transcriptional regulator n=1 Tax=Buttiauxella sp. A111 TaxID=2563088 RepID=UPI0010EEDD53|nr:LysR family transcriptional regulator [Buttiauxella sp. A111]GDX07866.1 LysR family transcriptional regulator [Buttiauxella sp. A111]
MKIDFNSLVILNAVVESGSVSVAAQRLSISPSSVTYAINKLRRVTDNPIFTRSKTGVKPTTLAHELNTRYKKTVHMINEGLGIDSEDNPSDVSKTITISTYTYVELWISQMTLKKESIINNGILNFLTHPSTNDERLMKLRNREVDIDIGAQLPNDPSIVSYRLFSSAFKVMVSKNHSTIKDSMSIKDWSANKHVTWNRINSETSSMMGDAQIIEEMLDRETHITSDSSLNMMMMCAHSDSLMLIPEYFCCCIDEILPVKFFDIPFPNSMESSLYVHAHTTSLKDSVVEGFLNVIRHYNC